MRLSPAGIAMLSGCVTGKQMSKIGGSASGRPLEPQHHPKLALPPGDGKQRADAKMLGLFRVTNQERQDLLAQITKLALELGRPDANVKRLVQEIRHRTERLEAISFEEQGIYKKMEKMVLARNQGE